MRHYKKGRKLGTDSSHTKAIKKNLLVALFTNDRIKTLEARAKEVRGDVDRVISWAKKGDLHSRRLAIALVGDKELVREVFEKAAQGMWADRTGGYTRILKLGTRKGDNAPVVILELCTEPVASAKKDDKKTTKNKAAKKSESKASDKKADKSKSDKADDKTEAEKSEEKAEEDKSDDKKAEPKDEVDAAKSDEKAEDEVEAKEEKSE